MFKDLSQTIVTEVWRVRKRKTGEKAKGWGQGGSCPESLLVCFMGFDLYPKSKKLLKGLKQARDQLGCELCNTHFGCCVENGLQETRQAAGRPARRTVQHPGETKGLRPGRWGEK